MIINHWHKLKNFQSALPDTTAPTVPTGLTTSNVSSSSITLSWTASTDNVAVTGYDLQLDSTYVTTVTGTSYTFTGLSASTSYTLGVRAKDAAGNTSAYATTTQSTSAAGADITFVDSAYVSHGGGGASFTFNGLQSGDLVIVVSGDNSGSAGNNNPTNLTQIAFTESLLTSEIGYVFATGTSVSFTFPPTSGAPNWGSTLVAYRNVNQTTPLDVSLPTVVTANSATSITPPSITTTTANTLVLAVLVHEDTSSSLSSITIPSGYTKDGEGWDANSDTAKVITSKALASSGTESPGAFTHPSDESHAYTIALRKA